MNIVSKSIEFQSETDETLVACEMDLLSVALFSSVTPWKSNMQVVLLYTELLSAAVRAIFDVVCTSKQEDELI